MSARDAILARIRKAGGRAGSQPSEAELVEVRTAIARRARGPVPVHSGVPPTDALAQFRAECDRVGTTHVAIDDMAALPQAVARYLDAGGFERRIVGWREFASLDWSGAGVQFEAREMRPDDAAGLTGCFCSIAETGTLLLLGAPATPKKTALLPETHVAVVSRARLVATMEDAFALLRAEAGEPPRSTWFVSGPSRTADIEQTLVIGAHGPYRVHVILAP